MNMSTVLFETYVYGLYNLTVLFDANLKPNLNSNQDSRQLFQHPIIYIVLVYFNIYHFIMYSFNKQEQSKATMYFVFSSCNDILELLET